MNQKGCQTCLEIVQIINTHNPIWSANELIVILAVLLFAIILIIVLCRRKRILCSQAVAGLLLLLYLITVLGSTVFARMPGERRYQLEVFWSWKRIFHSVAQGGSMLRNPLFQENILNMFMLFPAGFLLPLVFARKMKWYQGLLFGMVVSSGIELLQLFLCRGLFEFDDIIHNSFGCMIGTLCGNVVWRWRIRIRSNTENML